MDTSFESVKKRKRDSPSHEKIEIRTENDEPTTKNIPQNGKKSKFENGEIGEEENSDNSISSIPKKSKNTEDDVMIATSGASNPTSHAQTRTSLRLQTLLRITRTSSWGSMPNCLCTRLYLKWITRVRTPHWTPRLATKLLLVWSMIQGGMPGRARNGQKVMSLVDYLNPGHPNVPDDMPLVT